MLHISYMVRMSIACACRRYLCASALCINVVQLFISSFSVRFRFLAFCCLWIYCMVDAGHRLYALRKLFGSCRGHPCSTYFAISVWIVAKFANVLFSTRLVGPMCLWWIFIIFDEPTDDAFGNNNNNLTIIPTAQFVWFLCRKMANDSGINGNIWTWHIQNGRVIFSYIQIF